MIVRACYTVNKPGIPLRYLDEQEAQRCADEYQCVIKFGYVLELQTERGVKHFELVEVPVVDAP